MLVREAAQRLQRVAPRAEQAVHVRQSLAVDLVRMREPQSLHVEGEAAKRIGPPQLAVVRGLQLLHQLRFAQQRAELSDRTLPVDAPHLARELGGLALPRPGREVG